MSVFDLKSVHFPFTKIEEFLKAQKAHIFWSEVETDLPSCFIPLIWLPYVSLSILVLFGKEIKCIRAKKVSSDDLIAAHSTHPYRFDIKMLFKTSVYRIGLRSFLCAVKLQKSFHYNRESDWIIESIFDYCHVSMKCRSDRQTRLFFIEIETSAKMTAAK